MYQRGGGTVRNVGLGKTGLAFFTYIVYKVIVEKEKGLTATG